MKVSDLFHLHQGNGLELINMTQDVSSEIHFVARTAENNGVVARVLPVNKSPFPAGFLTVALGGSVLSSFVQNRPFYTGFHVMVLEPKRKMSLEEKLFYCHAIKMNAYRYQYGRQANRTLKDIDLPSLPSWLKNYKVNYDRITTHNHTPISLSDIKTWKKFTIKDLFHIEFGKISQTSLLEKGNEVLYIGAKKHDNGVMGTYAYNGHFISKGNCLVFICDGQGSIGYNNYMDQDFYATINLALGYNEHLNKYNALFVVAVLDLERPKFSFGRKRKSTLADTVVLLPADSDGKPNWQYMENYIKSLPYGDLI